MSVRGGAEKKVGRDFHLPQGEFFLVSSVGLHDLHEENEERRMKKRRRGG